MLADLAVGAWRASAEFIAPAIHDIPSTCGVSFLYFVEAKPGAAAGRLLVYLKFEGSEALIAALDPVSQPQSDGASKWRSKVVMLGRYVGEARIVFRAQKGNENPGKLKPGSAEKLRT